MEPLWLGVRTPKQREAKEREASGGTPSAVKGSTPSARYSVGPGPWVRTHSRPGEGIGLVCSSTVLGAGRCGVQEMQPVSMCWALASICSCVALEIENHCVLTHGGI